MRMDYDDLKHITKLSCMLSVRFNVFKFCCEQLNSSVVFAGILAFQLSVSFINYKRKLRKFATILITNVSNFDMIFPPIHGNLKFVLDATNQNRSLDILLPDAY